MGDSKRFTSYFDLMDGFSAKFDALQKKINSVTSGQKFNLAVGIDDGGLQAQSVGISKAVENVKNVTKSHADVQKEAGKAVEQHTSATQKAGNALTTLKSKYEGVTGSVLKLAGSLAAMATGGAVAGLAYIGAMQSNIKIQDTVNAISGNKKNRVSKDQLNTYTGGFSGSGWTSSSKISETVQAAYLFGGKDSRGQKGLDLATAAEKIAYAKQESLGGASGGDLMRSATLIKGKLRPQAEGDFRVATADVAGTAGYDSLIKTARGRLKLLKKEAETINIKAEMDKRPWAVAQQNIADFQMALGIGIAGPMGKISMLIAGMAKAMKNVPGLAGIVGWAAILLSLAGAASMAISVFSPLGGAIMKVVNSEKLAAIATKVYAATQWIVAGSTAALGAIFGLLTGSISLSTLATWALNGAMAVLDALDPFTYLVAGAAILAGIIGYLVVKSGVLAPIWKDLKKIWKDITTGKFEKILPDIGKMIGKIDIGGIFKTIVGKGPEEILGVISTGITQLLRWVSYYIAPFISKIHEVVKKIQSILDWLYSMLQGALSWIKSGLGITKSQAKAKMDAEATNKGVTWMANGESGAGWYKNSVRQSGADLTKLNTLKTKYEKAPNGIFDLLGIADAVAKGMSGIGDIIANAIKSAFMDIPGMKELAKAIDDLRAWLEKSNIGGQLNSIGSNIGGLLNSIGSSITGASTPESLNGQTPAGVSPSGRKAFKNPNGGYDLMDEKGRMYNWQVSEDRKDEYLSMASGGVLTRTGWLKAHKGEAIVPAEATRGTGAIADALGGISTRGGPPNITVQNNNDFSGMKVASDIDIEALMRKIDKRIETVSLTAVKNALGQRRT